MYVSFPVNCLDPCITQALNFPGACINQFIQNPTQITEQDFTVTAANINTWINHGLNLSGDHIFTAMVDRYGKNVDSFASIEFSGLYQFRVLIPQTDSSTDPDLFIKVKLTRRSV